MGTNLGFVEARNRVRECDIRIPRVPGISIAGFSAPGVGFKAILWPKRVFEDVLKIG